MITKFLNRKTVLIGCQLLTVVGVLVGLCAGGALLWEITDAYVLVAGKWYTIPLETRADELQHVLYELTEDGLECGLTAAVALVIALLSAISATVLAWLTKSAPQS